MKKFLSLVLALVMTMSLVTISAGAKDFADDDAITYEEAVAVLSEIGVVDGYTDGSFKPATALNRGQAAKIICNLILGPTTAADLSADTAPFSDVGVDHIFAGYIAFCVEEGIISGYADGTFKPAAPLTSYAFMKMLLGALGYDAETEGYVGANWSINVAKRALNIGLTDGLEGDFNGVDTVIREEAALYAFNTLKATMVEYDSKTVVTIGDANVSLSGNIQEVEWAGKVKDTIEENGLVEFAEKYFPDLECEVVNGTYGRPANKWVNDNDTIGTYTSIKPAFVYTEGTKEKDVYADLGENKIDDSKTKYTLDWNFYNDGADVTEKKADGKAVYSTPEKKGEAAKKNWEATADGTVTEIYVIEKNEGALVEVRVVMINNYLGEVVRVKSDDDGEYITVKALSAAPTLKDKTFYVEGYEKEDLVVFTVDVNDDGTYIASIADPEMVTGEVARVQKTEGDEKAYLRMADGEKYEYSVWNVYDLDNLAAKDVHPELNEEYNLYLDPNGFVVAFELAGEEEDPQYLYVKDSDEEMGEWTAKVLLPDGTTTKVELDEEECEDIDVVDKDTYGIRWNEAKDGDTYDKVNKSNIDGKVFAYSVNDDGEYDLDEVVFYSASPATIENDEAYVYFTENDKTKTFIVDEDTLFVDDDNETAYTGYSEVPNIDEANILYVLDEKIAEVVFVLGGEIYDTDSVYFMVDDITDFDTLKHDKKYYRIAYDAYVNGEAVDELFIRKDVYDADKTATPEYAGVESITLYKVVKTVDEEYITKIEKVNEKVQLVAQVGNKAFYLTDDLTEANLSIEKADKYTVNDDTVFVTVEAQYDDGKLDGHDISIGDLDDMKVTEDDAAEYWTAKVMVVESDEGLAELVYIFRQIEAPQTPANPT